MGTKMNRIKSLGAIYAFLGRNVPKWPRWLVSRATPEEERELAELKARITYQYGLMYGEADELFNEALERLKQEKESQT